jgi:hypothetical protein
VLFLLLNNYRINIHGAAHALIFNATQAYGRYFYLSMTMKRLIHTLGKLHVQYITNERILYPVTKEQKKIFEAFRLPEPL